MIKAYLGSLLRFVYPLTPFLLAAFLLRVPLLWCRGRRTSPGHELGLLALLVYLMCVALLTVNYRRVLLGHFSWPHSYNLTPFAGIAQVLGQGGWEYVLANIAGNVAMFLPFGLLLPLLWAPWARPLRTVGAGFVLSVGIETLQFFTGRSADVDDVLLNTSGALLGYLCFAALIRAAPRAALLLRRPLPAPVFLPTVPPHLLASDPPPAAAPVECLPHRRCRLDPGRAHRQATPDTLF